MTGPRNSQYAYEVNGNLTCRGPAIGPPCPAGSGISWNAANHPSRIDSDPDDYMTFAYGPDRQRVRRTVYAEGVTARVVDYIGPHFEVELAGGDTMYHSRVFFGDRPVLERRVSNQTGLLREYFVHQDHLGSVDRLTLAGGSPSGLDTSYSFDAFGKRRRDSWAADPADEEMSTPQWTERGYTDHEHLDKVKLVHMNGRLQDPILGRMISADPLLGDLGDPQSLNRYSYVRNNPLGMTDPSGLCATGSDSDMGSCESTMIVRAHPPPTGGELANWTSFVEGTLDAWIEGSQSQSAERLDNSAAQAQAQIERILAAREPTESRQELSRGDRDLISGLSQSLENVGPAGTVLFDRSTAKAIGKLGPLFAAGNIYPVTSGFGNRKHPISGVKAFHSGIDIAVPQGTKLLSPMDGRVEMNELRGAGGLTLVVQGKGDFSAFRATFQHLSSTSIGVGVRVSVGDAIAMTGGARDSYGAGQSTAAHLHYSLRVNGQLIDPSDYYP